MFFLPDTVLLQFIFGMNILGKMSVICCKVKKKRRLGTFEKYCGRYLLLDLPKKVLYMSVCFVLFDM